MKQLEAIPGRFAIAKIGEDTVLDEKMTYCFLAKTDKERSLVCLEEEMPDDAKVIDPGWKAFRFAGSLDFSLIGILASVTAVLADHRIGLFAVSTYDTDYVFVKEHNWQYAQKALKNAGYTFYMERRIMP